MLRLLSNHDPVLKAHLKTPRLRNTTYISPYTQNEIIDIIGKQMIQKSIIEEVILARFYSIMVDEVTSHNQELMPLCVRFVDTQKNIREEFIQFSTLTRVTGEAIAGYPVFIWVYTLFNFGYPVFILGTHFFILGTQFSFWVHTFLFWVPSFHLRTHFFILGTQFSFGYTLFLFWVPSFHFGYTLFYFGYPVFILGIYIHTFLFWVPSFHLGIYTLFYFGYPVFYTHFFILGTQFSFGYTRV